MKVVVLDMGGEFECHKEVCKDVVKKLNISPLYWDSVQNHWIEDSLAEAEENFNEAGSENAGYIPPWVWAEHVQVYPCAKEGK